MRLKIFLFIILLSSLFYGTGSAQIPQVIAYQGYLSSNGIPVTSQGLPASFTLYDAQSGGNPVWNQQSQNVQVSNGYYSAILDFSTGWQVGVNGQDNFTKQYWLQVFINNVNLTPRVQLTSSPSAMNARRADTANVAMKLAHDAPIGSIVAFGGTIFNLTTLHNAGWYVCDGSQISATDYPDYVTAIGQVYGVSVDGKMVNLPDLRGMFLRGVNDQRADALMDPDANSRIASHSGGLTGNSVGTVQADAIGPHKHVLQFNGSNITGPQGATWGYGPGTNGYQGILAGSSQAGSGGNNTSDISPTIGSETRPKNAYVYWIIKVK